MIDRKTALICAGTCAGLVALMFAAAFGRITSPEAWPAQMAWLPPSVVLFVPPAVCTLFTGLLYRRSFRVSADGHRFELWQRWWFLISACALASLSQSFIIVQSLGLHVPLAIGRSLAVLMMIVPLLGINQMPWFERMPNRFSLGGEIGPVYGPRFVLIMSRVLVVYMIAVFAAAFAFTFAAPATLAQRWGVPTIFGATALFVLLFLLWSMVWRIHHARKWRLERAAHG